jgi:hypothetical protein
MVNGLWDLALKKANEEKTIEIVANGKWAMGSCKGVLQNILCEASFLAGPVFGIVCIRARVKKISKVVHPIWKPVQRHDF